VCVVIGGKPQILGLLVHVVEHLGAAFGGDDTYRIAATMHDGAQVEAIIARWKLQLVVGPKGKPKYTMARTEKPRNNETADTAVADKTTVSQLDLLRKPGAAREAGGTKLDNPTLLGMKWQILAYEGTAARRAGLSDYNENPMTPRHSRTSPRAPESTSSTP